MRSAPPARRGFMRPLGLVLLLGLAACDPVTVGPPAASATPGKKPDLPKVPEIPSLIFADHLDRESHIVLSEGGPVTFDWNFDEKAHHAYEFNQRSQGTMGMIAKGVSMPQKSSSRHDGYVEFVGGGQGRAIMRYKRTLREAVDNDVPQKGEMINEDKPLLFECTVNQSGVHTSCNRKSGLAETHYLDILMALPPKTLAPGESAVREVHFARNVTDFAHHGKVTLRHGGRRKVDRYECVRLEGDLELDLAPAPGTEGHGVIKGKLISYFDPVSGKFVKAGMTLALAAGTRAWVQPGEGKGDPFWATGTTVTHMLVTVRLKE